MDNSSRIQNVLKFEEKETIFIEIKPFIIVIHFYKASKRKMVLVISILQPEILTWTNFNGK